MFIGTDTATVWVCDSTNPSLLFFVIKSPEDVLQWIHQSCRPEVFPWLAPKLKQGCEQVNTDDAIPDSQWQSEDDSSSYGSLMQLQSIANDAAADNGTDSVWDTSNESAGCRDKRPMPDASPLLF